MKSYWMESDGVNAQIELRDIEMPTPGPKQMLIRVRAAGLNRGEFILAHGLHKPGNAKPIGMEAAGEVVACGADVAGFQVGDRVMGRCAGAFSEYALLSEAEAMLGFLFKDADQVVIQDDARAGLPENAGEIAQVAHDALVGLSPADFTTENIQAALQVALIDGLELKPRVAFGPVRTAISGRRVSPPLFESMEILRRDESLKRLENGARTL